MKSLSHLAIAVVALVFSACSFESGLLEDASCEDGETRSDGATCERGFWVGGSELDADGADAKNNDSSPDMGADSSSCTPESDEVFCERNSKTCGVYEDVDNCGDNRQVTCGTCAAGDECIDNVCDCVPESDGEFCTRLNKNCDSVVDDDNCGIERTVDCGDCDQNETCGEEAPNVCGCPCNIDGQCYPDGAINPEDPCEVCDPGASTADWTVGVGRTCDDGDLCTENDQCAGDGTCAGDPKDCSADDAECRVGTCDPSTGTCFGEAQSGTPCSGDGLRCTADLCNMGSCEHPLRSDTCLIDVDGTDTCFAGGDPNPDNGCEACIPGTSTSDWSADNGGSCTDGLGCTSDVCMGGSCQSTLDNGQCLIGGSCFADTDPNPADPCEVCDSSSDTSDWVDSGTCCEIGGRSFADGTLNPTNSCQECDASNDAADWSSVGSGQTCCPNNSGNWSCNGNGSCEKSNGDLDTCAP